MEFLAPSRIGESEFTEKRSRFIGYAVSAADEAEAKRVIDEVKARHRDARHNPWCYVLPDGAARSSDDGEPSGTSGAPMLEMLRHEGIFGAVIVVTRYFGGVLLGPGGLARAYTAAAKAALVDSEPMRLVRKARVVTVCSYQAAPKIKHEIVLAGGAEENAEYAEDVTIHALFDEERTDEFRQRIIEITSGAVEPSIEGTAIVPVGIY